MTDRWFEAIPYAQRCIQRRARLDSALESLRELLRRSDGVRAAYVFGSYVRDEISPTSDLDVLVIRDTFAEHARRGDDIYKNFSGAVGLDLWVVTPAEVRDRLTQTPFGRTIIADGVRIAGDSDAFPERLEHFA